MKTICIAFEDFWDGFDIRDNFIIRSLKKNYNVQVIDVKLNVDAKKDVQYVFCSAFSDRYLDYDCIRIYYTGENIFPDMNAYDYAIGFEHFSLGDRYIRYPLYLVGYMQDRECMLKKHKEVSDASVERKFCSMVVSNGLNASLERKEFFELLSTYKKVDSGGKYLNNIGIPEGVVDKRKFQEKYKFAIAFENSSDIGYCTEKLVQSFAAKTIPIYWGDPQVGNTFNSEAFINCHEFTDFSEVVEYIKKIDNDDDLYLKILRTPAVSENVLNSQTKLFEEWLCHIFDQEYEKAFRRKKYGFYRGIEEGLRQAKSAKIWENADAKKFHIANKWICLLNKNISILAPLYNQGIAEIVIYGMTDLALRLMEECAKKDSRISVLGITDKRISANGGSYEGFPLIPVDQLGEMRSEGVMIVVTAVRALKEIMSDLQMRGISNVIALQDLIYAAYDY